MKTQHDALCSRGMLFACASFAALLTAPLASAQATDATVPTDEETVVMDIFSVNSAKDYGYLRTNAATATRIGMEIQKVPMNINVMTEEQIRDTGVVTITDILRYTASGSPDSSFAMKRPANEATPQGNFTMRGFTINSLMRNGIFRYTAYNLDNVERVEIVKGPAAVFFGQGYPGGVINYITKKPVFKAGAAGTFMYTFDGNEGQKFTADINQMFSKQAAFRVVGAWSDLNGERDFEFRKNINITPSITFVPFANGKLKINIEAEYLTESFNVNQGSWTYSPEWFAAYANPTPALIAASGVADATAYRARILNSPANWIADVRKATNDPYRPLVTDVSPYAYYLNAKGDALIKDKKFNYTNRGAQTHNEVKSIQATVNFAPFPWLDGQYSYTKDNTSYEAYEGTWAVRADGLFNTPSGYLGSVRPNRPGYSRDTDNHQLDLIFKLDLGDFKNKFLTGAVYNEYKSYVRASSGPVYYSIPGYNYPTPPTNNVPNPAGSNGEVPVNQVIRDRNGNILSAQDVYQKWDPTIYAQPPIDKLFPIMNNLIDGGKKRTISYYLNWQAQMLNEKLTLLAGVRRESIKGYGQYLTGNYPWFSNPPDAGEYPDLYPENVYNYNWYYSGDPDTFRTRNGTSWMAGVSYAITPEISVYATVSKTFKVNSGVVGDYYAILYDNLLTDALTNGGGQFTYKGKVIHNLDEGRQIVRDNGADQPLKNETGMNYEMGVKTALFQSKLVSTVSIFQGVRKNQKLDDSQLQTNANEPFNYSTTMFAPTSSFYNKRNFRWRTTETENQIRGIEADVVWTPIRNYQAVINGAWMWQAETLKNPAYKKNGSDLSNMYYDTRIENVPEFRFNMIHKYTFTKGAMRGLSVGANMRYSSELIIARSWDYNPYRGGFTAGNYTIFDLNASYPWTLGGYKFTTGLYVYNLFDKTYYEGSTVPSDHRTWMLRTSLSF